MSQFLNVVIVLGRCRHSRRPFGIRFEEKGRNRWLADWAFAVKKQRTQEKGMIGARSPAHSASIQLSPAVPPGKRGAFSSAAAVR
jgi:hypothetical protein